jgi:hypothetical protein
MKTAIDAKTEIQRLILELTRERNGILRDVDRKEAEGHNSYYDRGKSYGLSFALTRIENLRDLFGGHPMSQSGPDTRMVEMSAEEAKILRSAAIIFIRNSEANLTLHALADRFDTASPTSGDQERNTQGTCSRCGKMAWEHPHEGCEVWLGSDSDVALNQALGQIDALGERLCCYGGEPWPHRICDCKYPFPDGHRPSEVTGCPELREIRDLICRALESPSTQETGSDDR